MIYLSKASYSRSQKIGYDLFDVCNIVSLRFYPHRCCCAVAGRPTPATGGAPGELEGYAPPSSSAPSCSVAAEPFLSATFSFTEVIKRSTNHWACMDWPS